MSTMFILQSISAQFKYAQPKEHHKNVTLVEQKLKTKREGNYS